MALPSPPAVDSIRGFAHASGFAAVRRSLRLLVTVCLSVCYCFAIFVRSCSCGTQQRGLKRATCKATRSRFDRIVRHRNRHQHYRSRRCGLPLRQLLQLHLRRNLLQVQDLRRHFGVMRQRRKIIQRLLLFQALFRLRLP